MANRLRYCKQWVKPFINSLFRFFLVFSGYLQEKDKIRKWRIIFLKRNIVRFLLSNSKISSSHSSRFTRQNKLFAMQLKFMNEKRFRKKKHFNLVRRIIIYVHVISLLNWIYFALHYHTENFFVSGRKIFMPNKKIKMYYNNEILFR